MRNIKQHRSGESRKDLQTGNVWKCFRCKGLEGQMRNINRRFKK